MTIRLQDHMGEEKRFDIGPIENIRKIVVKDIYWDEVAIVSYRDGTHKTLDSAKVDRLFDETFSVFEVYDSDAGFKDKTWFSEHIEPDPPKRKRRLCVDHVNPSFQQQDTEEAFSFLNASKNEVYLPAHFYDCLVSLMLEYAEIKNRTTKNKENEK
ncbi:MAG: hypothetical protein MJZ81_11815 [Bacteroidales bacterium]|nr:hypothetical protein [Bacteroidales bacterium]